MASTLGCLVFMEDKKDKQIRGFQNFLKEVSKRDRNPQPLGDKRGSKIGEISQFPYKGNSSLPADG